MQLPVLIESLDGKGYRAKTGEPLAAAAEGATRDEALRKLEQILRDRLASGAEIVAVELPDAEPPWAKYAGILKDNPLYDEWREAIEEYRRQRDIEDGIEYQQP
jgi:hypothetical protein